MKARWKTEALSSSVAISPAAGAKKVAAGTIDPGEGQQADEEGQRTDSELAPAD